MLRRRVWVLGFALAAAAALCRADDGDMVAQAPHLVLHQLAVLGRQAMLVTMEQIAKLDVVETRVVALGPRGQVDAHRAV